MQQSQVHIFLLIFQAVCLAIFVFILVGQSRKGTLERRQRVAGCVAVGFFAVSIIAQVFGW